MNVPEGILCAQTHEYVYEQEGVYTIGVTDLGTEKMGDLVFVELPEIGTKLYKDEVFATLETISSAVELYMPIGATVIAVNEHIAEFPQVFNEDPYYKGWLIKVKSESKEDDSLDLFDYTDYIEECS